MADNRTEYEMDDIDAEIKMLMRGKSTMSVDMPRKSALDYKLEKKLLVDDEERKGLIHRMVVISKLHHNDFDKIGSFFEKYFREKQTALQCEGVTGLLLLYPKHCVHVVESCNEMLVSLARELHQEEEGNPVNVEKSKILISSHDITNRLYQGWSYRIIDIEAPNLDDYEPTEASEKVVVDMLVQLLHLGVWLSKNTKAGTKPTDSLHDKVPEHMPQQTVVGYLLENENKDTACVMPVKEYMDLYTQPYDLVLESEYTWPMPIRLFPYN